VLLAAQHAADSAHADLADRFRSRGVQVLEAPAREVERVSDTVHSQGIVAAAPWQDVAVDALEFGGRARVIALDSVSDPGNVGTIIRTAAWFGADAVILGRDCADLLNPKTVRATMGGLFHLPVVRDALLPEAVTQLAANDFGIAVAAADGTADWREWADAERALLILGSEAHGVQPALIKAADKVCAIPLKGQGESLNVAVTAGIFLSALLPS
jgi:TrmH family RNA methyltransferase